MDHEMNETEMQEVDGQIREQEAKEAREDKLAAALRHQREARIIAAYEAYLKSGRADGWYQTLLDEVWKFALLKVRWVETQLPEIAVDSNDIAQDTVIAVIKGFPSFKGETASKFLSWLKRICFCHRNDFFKKSLKSAQKFESLFTEHEDSDNNEWQTDNPAMYVESEGVGGYFQIPEWITGDDRYIKLIMDGKTYEQIGGYIGCSEGAVKTRVRRLREHAQKNGKKSWGRGTF
jgi:RNA polymerase sigma factor (sigma-70 family)